MTLHQCLGHPSEDITRAPWLKLGIKMKGSMREYEGCRLDKTRQKNIKKEYFPRSEKISGRMFVDISSIKYKSIG